MAEGRTPIAFLERYRCDRCKREFVSGWTGEEAWEEARARFDDDELGDDIAILCDPCFEKFKAWFDQLTPEQRAEIRAHG